MAEADGKSRTDVHSPERRSYNMSRIRGRDTRPELILRRGLHAAGLRYRLHVRDLPGRPDLVFPRHRVAVFVHGCFWHGHECPMFRLPATRTGFWQEKIGGNQRRDEQNRTCLVEAGWRVLTVWECATRGPGRLAPEDLTRQAAAFIRGPDTERTLRGSTVAQAQNAAAPTPIHTSS